VSVAGRITGHGRDPDTVRFCTEHSLAAGEPLAGWGTHPARNVLIRWPKSKWRHSLRIAAGMAGETQAAIERVVAAGWRVNLIDRKGTATDRVRVYLYPDAVAVDLAHGALPAFLDAVPRGPAALAGFAPRPAARPLVLCCTHGRHDRCCAKWGFAVYRALAREAGRRGVVDVWEATHLGGCRLAAGVLVLPALRKYGRLAPRDAEPLLAAEAAGRPYLPCYRGAAHLSQPAQVAEVTALKHLAEHGIRAPATVREIGEEHFAVAVGTARVAVQVRRDAVSSYGACADLDAAAPLAPKTVWHGVVLPGDPKR